MLGIIEGKDENILIGGLGIEIKEKPLATHSEG